MKKLRSPLASAALLTVSALVLLSGCGGEGGKKAPSQVVARVNGKEITVHQLNFLLNRQQNPDSALKQKALDTLVDQEILVQKAEDMKLDRDPSVVQLIEQAKRDILARSVLDRLTSKSTEVTDQAVNDFYAKNPHMFAERHIYVVDNFVIERAAFNDDLKAAMDSLKTADETAQLLQARGIRFGRQEGKVPAEQLPPAMQQNFASMKPGDILPQEQKDKLMLIQLREAVSAPVQKEQATAFIKQRLASMNKGEAIASNVKTLKAAAKIEYVQKFDDTAAAPVASAANGSTDNGSDALKEGLKGLK